MLWCNEDFGPRIDVHDSVFDVVGVAYGKQTMALCYTACLVQYSILDNEFLWIMIYRILTQCEGPCF